MDTAYQRFLELLSSVHIALQAISISGQFEELHRERMELG